MTIGVSDRFRAAYNGPHIVVSRGYLYGADGSQIGGEVTFDRLAQNAVNIDVTAANRRSAVLQLVDFDGVLLPLTPFGSLALVNEIRLFRGIQFAPGDEELAPLGVFGIQTAKESATPAGPGVSLTAIDRSKRLDVDLVHGLSFAKGTTFDVIFAALADASGVIFDKFFDDDVAATAAPAIVFHAGDNIWQQIQTAASSLGCWAYFDEVGVFTVVPVPDPDGQTADWAYMSGPTAMFDESDRQLALEDGSQKAYSHAVIQSNVHGTDTPLRSDAYDTDPSSPTYYLGPFGDRPVFDSDVSSFVGSQPQADKASVALLRRNYGLLERVTVRGAPNPALTGGDVLLITDPKSDTDGTYITEQIPMPLFAAGGESTIVCRSRQLH